MQHTRTDAAAQRSDSATAVDTLKDRAWTLLHEREAEGRDGYSDKDDDAKREEQRDQHREVVRPVRVQRSSVEREESVASDA